MQSFVREAALLAVLLVSACGGGGGGTPGIVLSTTFAKFSGFEDEAPPPPQTLNVRVNHPGTTTLGAGYRDGVASEWLGVSITGSAPDYLLRLQVTTTDMAPGTYRKTLTVGIADETGNILDTQDVAVEYRLGIRAGFTDSEGDTGFTYGGSDLSNMIDLAVRGPGQQWSARSNSSWLTVPAETYQGSRTLTATVDARNLAIGTYQGTITLVGLDGSDAINTATVTAVVRPPTLTVPESITLGGPDGLDHRAVPLAFSIDTGMNQYPWALTLSTKDGTPWLLADKKQGAVGSTAAEIQLSAEHTAVKGASYQGIATLSADVAGIKLSRDIKITFNKDAERLYVMSEGVAFTKLPSRQLLSRDIDVVSTLGRNGVPWQASANAAWLSVTTAGVTGDAITLTADPTGLTPNQTYIAQVTLRSDDPAIENTQTIRVGLWVGNSNSGDLFLSDDVTSFVVSQVEPLVYTYVEGAADIIAYNIYTGEAARRITANSSPGAMALNDSGSLLYVADKGPGGIRVFNTERGTGRDAITDDRINTPSLRSLYYARPSALPTLFTSQGHVVDLNSGDVIGTPADFEAAQFYFGEFRLAIPNDSRSIYANWEYDRSRHSVARPSFLSTDISLRLLTSKSGGGDDMAISPDGSRLYTVEGGVYSFLVFDALSLSHIKDLPGEAYPNNVAVAWDGTFVGGRTGGIGDDLWFYSAQDEPLGTRQCSGEDGRIWGLREDTAHFSGDGLRVVCTAGAGVYVIDTP